MFDGHSPREVHEFYDADGNRCKASDAYLTLVIREPEWDDASRGRALRLAEYEDGICGCGCNLPLAIARDPNSPLVVDEFTCYGGQALEKVREKQRQDDEDAKAPPRHGKHLYVRVMDPERDAHLPRHDNPRGGQSGGQVSPGPTPG